MITVMVTFQLPTAMTLAEARTIFLGTAPKYQAVAGLIRKYYVLSQDGKTAGGIYLWKSQAEAQALYTESWKAFVREKYGCDPSVVYMDSPVVVDNLSHEIIADQ
ncbi:MAG: YdhR family protein [Comamonadaceae bacterium]|jgi:Putative mono-oxygenase ydhR